MSERSVTLDGREIAILKMLATGAPNKAIAVDAGYTEGSLRVFLHHLYQKIGVRNRTAAAIWWQGNQPRGEAARPQSFSPSRLAEPKLGASVAKIGGDYSFKGIVVASFKKLSGVRRFVVEDDRGVLHIYGPQNLRVIPEREPRRRVLRGKGGK